MTFKSSIPQQSLSKIREIDSIQDSADGVDKNADAVQSTAADATSGGRDLCEGKGERESGISNNEVRTEVGGEGMKP